MEHVEAHSMKLLGSVPAKTMKSSAAAFQRDDVLYGRLRPYLNKVCKPGFDGLCSSEFIVLPDQPHLRSSYLQYRLNSTDFTRFANSLNAGDRPRVDFEQIGEFEIELPQEREQLQIVAKIEELFSDLDAGVATLERAQSKLKRYRASMLKAAVEGRLTEKWRAGQKAEGIAIEPAAKLLERVLAERRKKWETAQVEKYATVGKAPSKGWQTKYTEPAVLTVANLPALPRDWCWVRAEQICEFITKGTTPSSKLMSDGAGDIPFIKVYNLTTSTALNFSIAPTYVSQQTHSGFLARSRVLPDDVLMNIVGPPLGKVSIVPDAHAEWNINQAIALFRPIDGVSRKYFAYLLLTSSILAWAIKRTKTTAGQVNLTLEICRDLPIPLPSTAEQNEIVTIVESALSTITHAESEIEHSLARGARLRQAILKRAFEGRLC
jgi:type I restriction enzyme S subunit